MMYVHHADLPPFKTRTLFFIPGTWLAGGSQLSPSPEVPFNLSCFGQGYGSLRGQHVPMVDLWREVQQMSSLLSFISEELSGRPTDGD